jgi:hypothetical protein
MPDHKIQKIEEHKRKNTKNPVSAHILRQACIMPPDKSLQHTWSLSI